MDSSTECQIVPDSATSEETGNTKLSSHVKQKQCNKAKNWRFTLNNYTEEEIDAIVPVFNEKCIKWLFEEEVGEKGTPHLQGFIMLKEKMRPTELKLTKRISWHIMSKSEKENITYCTKDRQKGIPGRVWKSSNINIPRPLKIIEELRPWQKSLENILLEEPDDRKIIWVWENEGNVGKSAFCKYLINKYDALYGTEGKKSDIINLVYNYVLTKELMHFILDVPRENGNNISYKSLEEIKNGMICNTKYETGTKLINSPHIIVFANQPPILSKFSKDRWEIYEIINGELVVPP